MGISMLPEEFPPQRREDPKRKAEVRVFDALENLSHNGHGIYELRFREKGRQLDFALWLDRWGRFALQIKGGIYRLEKDGKWYLLKPDGSWIEVASPLEETEEGCIEMHNAIEAASNYYGFVVGVLVFPDMERDEQMEWVARNHHHVHIVWGVETLQEDQERIAKHVGIERPPKPYHSEYECRRVFELQYRGINYVNGRRDEERREDTALVPSVPAPDGDELPPMAVGSATFHIQHVGKLVVQHINVGPDDYGRIQLLEA